ncbi:MAG: hypothetical protein JJU29_13845 [Verrucomicrobia bacterium]|nr:hypothetical protein [Verrucomicrobiota bacterium]MCH8513767.1 hypothetical protein [Kiritimatiellia bacterium]
MKKIYLAPVALLAFALFSTGCGNQRTPAPAATADAAFRNFTSAIESNDPVAVWNFLPGSYQADVNGLLNEFAEKMDAQLWNAGTGTFKKVEEVLRTKKDLILTSPMLEQVPGKEEIEANYGHLVNILGILAKSDLMDLEKMKSADLGRILSTTGKQLIAEAEKMDVEAAKDIGGIADFRDMQSEMTNMKAELISEEGDEAVVRITGDGDHDDEVEFVRVEGKWIPKDLAEEWPQMIADAREGLQEIGQLSPQEKQQVMMGINMVNGVLDQMLAAETHEDMQNVIAGVMGMMMGGF